VRNWRFRAGFEGLLMSNIREKVQESQW
jgi:hypothetical protein